MTREEAEQALEVPARKRVEAKERLRLADEELRPYVQRARKAGVSLRVVAQKTGLSANTISLWEARETAALAVKASVSGL